MLVLHAPDLWTATVDHPFLGLKFGARMTVVRLPDGGLWLHSPVPLTDALRAEVDALGPVRAVAAPNLFHHLYAGHWAAAYPDARLFLAPGLEAKRKDLHGETLAGADPWGDALRPVFVEGWRLHETTFWHPATRTLITSDVVANLPPTDHLWTRFYSWMTGLRDGPSVNRILRAAVNDRAAARRSLDGLVALGPDRLILAHGRVVEEDGATALTEAWSWLR